MYTLEATQLFYWYFTLLLLELIEECTYDPLIVFLLLCKVIYYHGCGCFVVLLIQYAFFLMHKYTLLPLNSCNCFSTALVPCCMYTGRLQYLYFYSFQSYAWKWASSKCVLVFFQDASTRSLLGLQMFQCGYSQVHRSTGNKPQSCMWFSTCSAQAKASQQRNSCHWHIF